jgi:hypothetical protein
MVRRFAQGIVPWRQAPKEPSGRKEERRFSDEFALFGLNVVANRRRVNHLSLQSHKGAMERKDGITHSWFRIGVRS